MQNGNPFICDEERGILAAFEQAQLTDADKNNEEFMLGYTSGLKQYIQGMLEYGSKEALEARIKECESIADDSLKAEFKLVKDEKILAMLRFKCRSAFTKGVVYGMNTMMNEMEKRNVHIPTSRN